MSAPYSKETAEMIRAIRNHSGMNLSEIAEVAKHGADAGFPGFIYTSDAVKFYEEHHAKIWDMLWEDAEGMGTTPIKMIAGFNRADMATTYDGFANLLAWYALERAAQNYTNR